MSDIFKVNSASLSELCETLKVVHVVEALSSRLSFDLAGATADTTETAKDSKKFD